MIDLDKATIVKFAITAVAGAVIGAAGSFVDTRDTVRVNTIRLEHVEAAMSGMPEISHKLDVLSGKIDVLNQRLDDQPRKR